MTMTYPRQKTRLELSLDTGAVLDLRPPLDIDVRCGALWITQTGDTQDHVLVAGESYRVTEGGLVVVQALEPAVLSAH